MASYELQIFANEHWQIALVADDRAEAIADAKRVYASQRHLAVRVVEERFDPTSETFITKTIYRGNRGQEPQTGLAEDAVTPSRHDTEPRARFHADRAARFERDPVDPGQWLVRGFALACVLIGGAAALAALQWLRTLV